MDRLDTIEMLAFNLKLVSKKTKKHVLISAGTLSDKQKMLPSIVKLNKLGVSVYATVGTHDFLNKNGIRNELVHKITDRKEPNIMSLLTNNRFDLVINVLTGDNDYDENSDSKIIRKLAVENGIPLITDVDIASLTIDSLLDKHKREVYQYKIADPLQPWNLKLHFFDMVGQLGGFACYHAHFDKAYLISLENLRLSQVEMQKKWELYKYLKENYSHGDLLERISRGVETMIRQGVTHCRTMVDADSTVKLLPIQAALEVKAKYKDKIKLEIGIQPLEGVLKPEPRKFFEQACEMADVIGGLPSRDRPVPEEHLDFILSLGKRLNKKVDVHVDQENNPYEDESAMLAKKTIKHGMEGRVFAIHAVSISAKPEVKQDEIIHLLKDAGIKVIVCPSAALSMKQLKIDSPLHNSIAPVTKLIEADVPVLLGADNIHDLFMPFVDGDMWFESRLLMEACRFYDIDKVAKIACDKSGFMS